MHELESKGTSSESWGQQSPSALLVILDTPFAKNPQPASHETTRRTHVILVHVCHLGDHVATGLEQLALVGRDFVLGGQPPTQIDFLLMSYDGALEPLESQLERKHLKLIPIIDQITILGRHEHPPLSIEATRIQKVNVSLEGYRSGNIWQVDLLVADGNCDEFGIQVVVDERLILAEVGEDAIPKLPLATIMFGLLHLDTEALLFFVMAYSHIVMHGILDILEAVWLQENAASPFRELLLQPAKEAVQHLVQLSLSLVEFERQKYLPFIDTIIINVIAALGILLVLLILIFSKANSLLFFLLFKKLLFAHSLLNLNGILYTQFHVQK